MKRLLVAYVGAIAVALLGIASVTSSVLAANEAVLSGGTGLVIGISVIGSFAFFWFLTAGTNWGVWARIANGLLASTVMPLVIAFSPLLVCVFVTHGTCS